jgi:hypothetical protein
LFYDGGDRWNVAVNPNEARTRLSKHLGKHKNLGRCYKVVDMLVVFLLHLATGSRDYTNKTHLRPFETLYFP